MFTVAAPAIHSANVKATAAPPVAAHESGNAGARQVAACFGIACNGHAKCPHYKAVEKPGQERFVESCEGPKGVFPWAPMLVGVAG